MTRVRPSSNAVYPPINPLCQKQWQGVVMPSHQARSPKKRVLEPAEIEKNVSALAAKGYSMTAGAKAMQTSFRRLRELCASLIKPIHWPHRSISQQEVITERKGVLRPRQKEGLKRGTQSRRSKGRQTVDRRTGNIDYHQKPVTPEKGSLMKIADCGQILNQIQLDATVPYFDRSRSPHSV